MIRRCADYLFRHRLLTYGLMGLFFILFGVGSVDLYMLLEANIRLFIGFGLMAIDDGALVQLLELLALTLLCVACFVLFAVCERILVKRLMAGWIASRAR